MDWLTNLTSPLSNYAGKSTIPHHSLSEDSKGFDVKVEQHQGFVLSPLIFVIAMEIITTELRARFPMELLYADDFVLMAKSAKTKFA